MGKSDFDPRAAIADAQQHVSSYGQQVLDHPIASACAEKRVPKEILESFARCQYVDSTTWVSMLGLVKGAAVASKLREAVRMNIDDEVGANGTPHVTLCKRFLRSIGVSTDYLDIKEYSPASVYPVGLMLGLAGNCSDPMIGGWLLSQEVLVPYVFRTFRPAFVAFDGADVTYLTEHEEVDADVHSQWIEEALVDVVVDSSTAADAVAGVHMGGRATLSVLDYLYSSMLQRAA